MTEALQIMHIPGRGDLSPAWAIRDAVFVAEQAIAKDLERDDADNVCDHFVVLVQGQPLATGRLRQVGEKIKFERIATLAAARGRGVGKALMESMEAFARENFPQCQLWMAAQESAVGFYEKIGWHRTGEPFEEAGIPHQGMTKS